ncbi:acyl carrier protein, partial [Gloeocapsa sp. PCC 73106]|uniref:acyl carrier protein n=1 Tax=Gloeocapsa sp. PCC 73106 TaxID=102232 RepID=UPI0002AC9426
WASIGAAARQKVSFKGIGAIEPEEGLAILEKLMSESVTQVGVIPIDWSEFPAISPFFADFSRKSSQHKFDLLEQLKSKRPHERQAFLVAYLQTEISKVLGLPTGQYPHPEQGFFELGMDSLMSIELRNRLEANLGQGIPATAIFQYPTIKALAQYIIEKNYQLEATSVKPQVPTEIKDSLIRELEELEALLGGEP